MRRALCFSILVATATNLAAQTGIPSPVTDLPVAQPVPLPDLASLSLADVIHVIDGDTVVLRWDGQERKCRLWGVDTPETVDPDRPIQPYGPEASRFLQNLLIGERVRVAVNQDGKQQDDFERLLVYLFRDPDGLFVNLEILRQGYGRAYTAVPFPYLDIFRLYETRARLTRKGMWGEPQSPAQSGLQPKPESATRETATGPTQTAIPAPSRPMNAPPPAPTTTLQPFVPRRTPPSGVVVYVTRTGDAYHRDGCRFLARSRIPIALREARARYIPCAVCKPPA